MCTKMRNATVSAALTPVNFILDCKFLKNNTRKIEK